MRMWSGFLWDDVTLVKLIDWPSGYDMHSSNKPYSDSSHLITVTRNLPSLCVTK
jgi:hypothetical protein